ncbi:hypothetical protein AVEN_266295-1 [Araneus ventricosus]|uniref:Uncharacterized protein n=1 Tax=Araneus ventricosus TaxID=182803 RepID=A0A4Y2ED60_ARAVE|nr:hypothetical protein AVEN_266295-1 [Araneus ventricosus]
MRESCKNTIPIISRKFYFDVCPMAILCSERPRWPSGKVSALGPEGSRFETRFHRRWSLLHAKSCAMAKRPPAQVLSPKLRGPPQNSPRGASKWDVNITKLI